MQSHLPALIPLSAVGLIQVLRIGEERTRVTLPGDQRVRRGCLRALQERRNPTRGDGDFNRNVVALAVTLTHGVLLLKHKEMTTVEHIGSDLSRSGFVRLSSILAPVGSIPVGRSTWREGVKSGRCPKPVELGPRTTAWRVEDIRQLIEQVS